MADKLSAREFTFVATAFQCMEEKPQIDYEKFAKMTGLKGAKSARDSFGPLLKKLMAAGPPTEGDGDSTKAGVSPSKSAKKTPAKRKVDAGDDNSPTPAKKTRGRKPKVKDEPAFDEDKGQDAADDVAPSDAAIAAIAATIKAEGSDDEPADE